VLLEGKVAIVSGVGPGLGREIAVAMAREGAAVGLGARTESYLKEVVTEIERAGGAAVAAPTDITDAGQCRRLVEETASRFGRVDCLVNNAFRPDVFKRFEEVDLDDWRGIVEVNLFGSLQLTQAVLPTMKDQRGGSIVFVNSQVVRKVLPRQGGYAVSKGALLTASQVLAKELGRHQIRVNSVVPGWMLGPGVEWLLEERARRAGNTVEEQYQKVASEMALGRIPTDEECAGAVVFFASDLSKVITGQSLDVNGGETFH
jgi:NAD(P)-dependent dehydrogenase (short-subunit alcohol dehydrogenase family)